MSAKATAPQIRLYGGLFAAAVAAFCLQRLLGARLGVSEAVFGVLGDATCGWSWLLVRALFRAPQPRPTLWPLAVVLGLVAAGAVLRLAADTSAAPPRMLDNLATLVSSTLLLLAAAEPLRGPTGALPSSERRFRIAFAMGYAVIMAIAVVWVNGAPAGSFADHWRSAIKAACAVLALAGMLAAIAYRARHGFPEARRAVRPVTPTGMGERLLSLMSEAEVYGRHDLRIAHVARRLGEPEHRVSRCITGDLGLRNFNQLANRFRIEDAKRRLADPRLAHLPVLTIAYDCGFASVGPFNRAFKAETGATPLQFRQRAGSL